MRLVYFIDIRWLARLLVMGGAFAVLFVVYVFVDLTRVNPDIVVVGSEIHDAARAEHFPSGERICPDSWKRVEFASGRTQVTRWCRSFQ